MTRRILILAILALTLGQSPAVRAWDEDGHAIVTYLAHDALGKQLPEWVRSEKYRKRLVYLSAEPDRWRGQHNVHLDHVNNPDHYLDIELLLDFGLTLETMPPLRRAYTDHIAMHKAHHDGLKTPKIEDKDKAYVHHVPGLLAHEIAELQWTIAAGWTQLKTFEAHPDRVSQEMLENARENIIYHMGIISHYVGDGAQPLHLTKHFNGWVGDNPQAFTTDKSFHAFIDDDVVRLHQINYDDLKARVLPARTVNNEHYWREILGYLRESNELVKPLYELEKSGRLRQARGKQFIEDRLLAAGSMLAGIWNAAYEGAVIDDFRVKRLKERYPKEPGRKAKINEKSKTTEKSE